MKNIKTFEEFLNEGVNEKLDTKYWAGYNDDTSPMANDDWAVKSKDFQDTFEDAIDEWNAEAEGPGNRIKGAQIKAIEKMAKEFFKIEKYISINIIQAMIAQES